MDIGDMPKVELFVKWLSCDYYCDKVAVGLSLSGNLLCKQFNRSMKCNLTLSVYALVAV